MQLCGALLIPTVNGVFGTARRVIAAVRPEWRFWLRQPAKRRMCTRTRASWTCESMHAFRATLAMACV